MKNAKYINDFFAESQKIIEKMPRADVDAAIEMLYSAWKNGSTVFLIGNGGSASTATHMAADLAKTMNVEGKKRLKAFALVDNIPMVSALTNDNGWENIYVEQLMNYFSKGDVVIAFSVHGGAGKDKAGAWSQNLLKALQYAKDNGGKAIGFAGFDGGAMKQMADVCVVVPANSTPQVEAFHVVLHHLIVFCLKEKIAASP
ncbi:MAG: SIS domain-containing protein [Candidatus Anstonellaceae archaeon]